MQIIKHLLRVIFMLSTIVYVTDCCSSRILLLKEHTLKFVRQRQQYQQQQQQQHHEYVSSLASSTQLQQKSPQHVDIIANVGRVYNKSFLSIKEKDQDESSTTDLNQPIAAEEITKQSLIGTPEIGIKTAVEKTFITTMTTEKLPTASAENKSIDLQVENQKPSTINASDFITDPAIREKHAGNPKYHVVDLYYTIMRDVLSYKCYGEYLTDFCLNGGRCFRFPIGNHSFYSCECADGFVGERCESKSVNELYMTTSIILGKDGSEPKILMARVVFTYPSLIVFSTVYILFAAIYVFKKRAANTLAG